MVLRSNILDMDRDTGARDVGGCIVTITAQDVVYNSMKYKYVKRKSLSSLSVTIPLPSTLIHSSNLPNSALSVCLFCYLRYSWQPVTLSFSHVPAFSLTHCLCALMYLCICSSYRSPHYDHLARSCNLVLLPISRFMSILLEYSCYYGEETKEDTLEPWYEGNRISLGLHFLTL